MLLLWHSWSPFLITLPTTLIVLLNWESTASVAKSLKRCKQWYFDSMATACLFCDNNSSSKEHLWPKWIHERKGFGPINFQLCSSGKKELPNPEIMVKTVCGVCNSGWMSKLEAANIPIIGNMLQDVAIPLDEPQQRLVAAWTVKTAMMTDSMKGRGAPNQFYSRDECINMRLKQQIPNRTLIWIGRMDGMHLVDTGTDFALFDFQEERVGMGSVTTIVAGHFVTQVAAVHIEKDNTEVASLPCKMGNWAESLVQIWPTQNPTVQWPPKASFTNGGPAGLAYLIDRWRMGEPVEKVNRATPQV
jgi:hypothetical protein